MKYTANLKKLVPFPLMKGDFDELFNPNYLESALNDKLQAADRKDWAAGKIWGGFAVALVLAILSIGFLFSRHQIRHAAHPVLVVTDTDALEIDASILETETSILETKVSILDPEENMSESETGVLQVVQAEPEPAKEPEKIFQSNPQPVTQQTDNINKDESLPPFYPIILKAATRYGIDPALIRAVIMAESSYNPNAVSRSGAMGLMQLMPRTARALGVEDILNPEHNINGGVKYLRQLMDRFDEDVTLALAAYNAGTRNVLNYNGVPPFRETRNYIRKVLTYYESYLNEMENKDDLA